jgi:hypothetical protein
MLRFVCSPALLDSLSLVSRTSLFITQMSEKDFAAVEVGLLELIEECSVEPPATPLTEDAVLRYAYDVADCLNITPPNRFLNLEVFMSERKSFLKLKANDLAHQPLLFLVWRCWVRVQRQNLQRRLNTNAQGEKKRSRGDATEREDNEKRARAGVPPLPPPVTVADLIDDMLTVIRERLSPADNAALDRASMQFATHGKMNMWPLFCRYIREALNKNLPMSPACSVLLDTKTGTRAVYGAVLRELAEALAREAIDYMEEFEDRDMFNKDAHHEWVILMNRDNYDDGPFLCELLSNTATDEEMAKKHPNSDWSVFEFVLHTDVLASHPDFPRLLERANAALVQARRSIEMGDEDMYIYQIVGYRTADAHKHLANLFLSLLTRISPLAVMCSETAYPESAAELRTLGVDTNGITLFRETSRARALSGPTDWKKLFDPNAEDEQGSDESGADDD